VRAQAGEAVSRDHPFATWNILDCGLDANSTGSHYWETKALARELVRQGNTVRIFSHRVAPGADLCAEAEIVPAFSLSLYAAMSKDATWSAKDHLIAHNRSFQSDLMRLDPVLFRSSLAMFPMVGANQLLGLLRWLASLSRETRPNVSVTLFEPRAWEDSSPVAGFYKDVWRECPEDVKRSVAIFARTPPGAAMFTTRLGIPATLFPYALPERFLTTPDGAGSARDAMTVSFVGGTRRDRGCALIPDVVKQCAETGVRFFIHVRSGLDAGFDHRTLTALGVLPQVHVEEGAMRRSALCRAIATSVILLPYRPDDYRWRDSGIYHEAKLLDAPILVTAGTWMADEVRSLGNGLVIEKFSAAAVVECIARARHELPALKAAAARIGKAARKTDGVGRCIAAVAGAFAGEDS
jgi:hypothetical protein